MRTFRKAALPLLLAGAMAIGWSVASVSAASQPRATGTHGKTTATRGAAPSPYFISGPLVSVGTYLSRGLNGKPLTGTFSPVEPRVKIRCPGRTGSCIVSAELNVALASTNSNVELCPFVDGSFTKSQIDCYANIGETGTGYQSYSFVYTFTIPHGTHHVRANALVGSGSGDLSYFSNVYTVYRRAG
jgi:hypothetical protein